MIQRWENKWQGPLETRLFIQAVSQRYQFVQQVASQKRLWDTHQPLHVYRPVAFLNALLQKTSRLTGVPIEELVLTLSLTQQDSSLIVPLKGIKLQGMKWVSNEWKAVESHDSIYSVLPPCYLAWIPNQEAKGQALPLYQDESRTTCVASVLVSPFELNSDWILGQVALFLM